MFFKKRQKSELPDDQELIQRFLQTRDNHWAGQLFDRYIHLVFGVCMKYLKNEELAKDQTMTIFEKLIVQLPKHDIQNFKSWLHVLTKNECLLYLRAQKSRPLEVSGEITVQVMESAPFVHLNEEDELEMRIQSLESCIDALASEQQRCVRLFYLEKKNYQEIVALTGFELKKVKSYLQNGRRNLKICIEKKGGRSQQP